ncbi:MAG: TetR/AcrR family transcriptional regulator [Deltaproteobacteria bacterium]|nr:TetR/AcrR family transcriptional regulator [Deltaproteobacteria bacterium]
MAAVRSRARGEKTRQKILDAAEEIFARDGFDAARMEDIANAVGIQRAGLFYYYKDKSALYQAMLDTVLSELLAKMTKELDPELPLLDQVENCAVAWVDFVWRRPDFARILLREGAKTSSFNRDELAKFARPLMELLQKLLEDAQQQGISQGSTGDVVHVASTLAGSTVFMIAVFPSIMSELSPDANDEERLEVHKREIRKLTRFLLTGMNRTDDFQS